MKIGKIDESDFRSLVMGKFGRRDASVLVPPMTGVDAGVIDLGGGRVLVVAEDPIFTMPRLPLEMFGRFTVHIGASDVAVMGVKPRYMTYSLLLPPETAREDIKRIVDSIHEAARGLGAEGLLLESDAQIEIVLREARAAAARGRPVLVNARLARSEFRRGSLSM